ncbi:MAG: DUF768 domain-containing protein [Mesorhizobium sp.]|nr:MAG: DUF768 domain-containing protein [Mesorhizobium sp.]
MSTRGINFFDRWMAEHLPNAITDDPVAVSDLTDEMFRQPSVRASLPPRSTAKSTASMLSFSRRCFTAMAVCPKPNSPFARGKSLSKSRDGHSIERKALISTPSWCVCFRCWRRKPLWPWRPNR